ncbi:MAG: thioredoxin family protein [Saprospiraceae bacterium]|nr:thioredoxin family protein [Saprospiraceae bacterium]
MRIQIFLVLMLLSQLGFGQVWMTDLDEAKALAAKEHHNIVLVFQGSDWCAPCMKLEQEIWSSSEFQEYAKDHYVLLKADFPRKKKNQLSERQQKDNNRLAEKYNQEGYFPLVVVLSPSGKTLGKTGYEHVTPSEYIKILNSLEVASL